MKAKIINIIFLAVALISIWFLVKSWMPSGYALAGHDSGLALNAKDFLLTRLNAWDNRINFGVDNSPHFGSLIMHSIDYLLSIVGGTLYSGNQVAVFFWISVIFISAFILSTTIEGITGKYFKFIFPVFVTFNFYIFQSIFILERAKYELYCVLLIFLALAFKVLKRQKGSVIKYSVVFSIFLSIFNGGSWFGLPLYGGLLVAGFVLFISVLIYSLKGKQFGVLRRISLFYLFNFVFFLLLNAYSILPYLATMAASVYGQVTNIGTIQSGIEWLNYISRGSSFLNLFRLQGVPDWYLTEFLPAPQHAYSGIYMTNFVLIFVSILFPVIGLFSLLLARNKEEKYLVSYALFLLLISMFFTAGPDSPLGFIYNFIYRKIPGFSIFRSPYFKFGYVYIISFTFLLVFSLSKIVGFTAEKLKKVGAIGATIAVLIIILGWLSFHYVIFKPNKLFSWQTDKSTIVKVPSYIDDFSDWIRDQKDINGRILLLPPLDSTWMAEYYSWGFWSLSSLPSVTFSKASFIVNDTNLSGDERDRVKELYLLLEAGDIASFRNLASRLSIKHLLLRKDFVSNDLMKYIDLVSGLEMEKQIELVKEFGEWSLFTFTGVSEKPMVYPSVNFAKVSANYFYLAKELAGTDYSKYSWLKFEDVTADNNLDNLTDKEFYYLTCESCQIENLGRYAQPSLGRIFPNSPLYQIKKISQKKLIDGASDEASKLNVYLGLVLAKLSEIESMRSLNIDKRFISEGLGDMYEYLIQVDTLLNNSEQMRNSFYITSKIYESLNPVQRCFRDKGEDIKDLTVNILRESDTIKNYFSSLTSQGELWSHEKLYKVDNLENGTYKLLVNSESLPVDASGMPIIPKTLFTKSGQEISFARMNQFSKWYETDYFNKSKDMQEIRFPFSKLPNLYLSQGGQQLNFPEGQRECLVGNISFFNKYKMYRLKLSSTDDSKSLKLYIKENINNKEDFMREDIVKDVFLTSQNQPFEYIYDSNTTADSPTIYFCGNDSGIPKDETVEVYEIFSPVIFAEKNVIRQQTDKPNIAFEEIDPSKFRISVVKSSGPFILVFNERFNLLWRLSDEKGHIVSDHFSVDGYLNGWLLDGKEKHDLTLEYYPQRLFKYGTWISLSTLAIIIIIYTIIGLKKKK